MRKENVFIATITGFAFLLSGCVVRTYQLTKERVDQDLTGNRGYISGQTPETQEQLPRETTRTTQVVELEMHSPIKFVKGRNKTVEGKTENETGMLGEGQGEAEGNKGYIFMKESTETIAEETSLNSTKYTVKKNDTLQKISKEFYGTTKKWNKIFEANKDTLKGPNKVYPGQVLNIPTDTTGAAELKEPKENLK